MIVFTQRRPLKIPPIGTPSFTKLSHSMCHLQNVLQLVGVHVGTMMDSWWVCERKKQLQVVVVQLEDSHLNWNSFLRVADEEDEDVNSLFWSECLPISSNNQIIPEGWLNTKIPNLGQHETPFPSVSIGCFGGHKCIISFPYQELQEKAIKVSSSVVDPVFSHHCPRHQSIEDAPQCICCLVRY